MSLPMAMSTPAKVSCDTMERDILLLLLSLATWSKSCHTDFLKDGLVTELLRETCKGGLILASYLASIVKSHPYWDFHTTRKNHGFKKDLQLHTINSLLVINAPGAVTNHSEALPGCTVEDIFTFPPDGIN